MEVFAFSDGRHDFADIGIVFVNCIAHGEVLECDFMPDGDIAQNFHCYGLVFLHDPAGNVLI